MPAANNKRIFYATHQVGIKGDGGDLTFGAGDEVHGVQSVGVSSNFNLEQTFELGQLGLYENREEIPDVEVTLNKVLDGYPLMYHMATQDTTVAPTLVGRSNAKCIFGLAIFPDTNEAAEGTADSVMACSGMFVNSVSYNFTIEDNFNEDVTLVGNHKIWANPDICSEGIGFAVSPSFPGQFAGNDDAPIGLGGINRRENLQFDFDLGAGTDANGMVRDENATILPPEIYGISCSGTNEKSNGQDLDAHLNTITVSVDFNREQINELGRKGPYTRTVAFPIEVTCEIEATSTSGDLVSLTEDGIRGTGTGICVVGTNLVDRTIRIVTCESTSIYLGLKNKLSAVNYNGGDAGGGNVTVSYTYTTFNDFTVLHSGDPSPSGTDWWNNRHDYLLD